MQQTKQQCESRYKVGQRIRIVHLEGEDTRYDGKEGVIEHIDGIGQLYSTWGRYNRREDDVSAQR